MGFQKMGWGLVFSAMVLAGIVCGVGGISKTMDGGWFYILGVFFLFFFFRG